jgi:hypothetical protein
MTSDWSSSKLIAALMAAGTKGMTKANLEKAIPKAIRSKSGSILLELRSTNSIHGPFKNRSDYYFAPQFAPTRLQGEMLIEKLLRDAGLRLTTKSDLSAKVNGFLRVFFNDALAALKSEAKLVELKRGPSIFYVHREAVLEQLRLTDNLAFSHQVEFPAPSNRSRTLTLKDIHPIYQALKREQGGISTVKIYDILTRLNAAKEDLHRLLVDEARNGRVSLHPASTVTFPAEVMAAGIRLEGQSAPLVTVILAEDS